MRNLQSHLWWNCLSPEQHAIKSAKHHQQQLPDGCTKVTFRNGKQITTSFLFCAYETCNAVAFQTNDPSLQQMTLHAVKPNIIAELQAQIAKL